MQSLQFLHIQLFQSTLPHGSDIDFYIFGCILGVFQSTLPHGSDSAPICRRRRCDGISIHAPSRERLSRIYCYSFHSNFNPRSLTGATCLLVCAPALDSHFNPRSLTGATHLRYSFGQRRSISIHAPSRERRPRPAARKRSSNFNPRSLTGATRAFERCATIAITFQSTLPHGSDTLKILHVISKLYFNPRSLTGATRYVL